MSFLSDMDSRDELPSPDPTIGSEDHVSNQPKPGHSRDQSTDGPPNEDRIRDLLDELEGDDDDDIEDVGKIKRRYMPKILRDDEEFNSSQVPIDTVSKREVQDLIESIPKAMVQKPVQPGASPSDEENRFLCWNNIGIIRAQFGEDNQNVDVMFHDTEKHSSVNFTNDPNYTFGSLSDDVIVLGSNGKYGTGPASIHGVNLLESNRDERDWEIELPHVELIEALACGSGFVSVVTDQRNLRLFTNAGMQSYLFTLPGQIVCMSALEKQLMIIYHNGAGHSDDQNLVMYVYNIDLFGPRNVKLTMNHIPVALSKRSPLAWAGFSDEGTPCTYDYSGMFRMYKQHLGRNWVPIVDLRELTSSALDHYFVVGSSEMTQTVRGVKCRKSRFPEYTTETSENIAFGLPLCNLDSDKGQLEEEHIRLRLADMSYSKIIHLDRFKLLAGSSSQENEKLLVNTILRMFAMYLKEDKEEAARGLVFMIPKDYMSKLPEFAWKANRRRHFIDSLNDAIEEREQLELAMINSQMTIMRGVGNIDEDDDIISIGSGITASQNSFGKDLDKELRRSQYTKSNNNNNNNNNSSNNNINEDDVHLKPISLDKLMMTNNNNNNNSVSGLDGGGEKEIPMANTNNKTASLLDDDLSGDENDAKRAKRIKTVNYNLFSKKRPKS